MRSVFLASAALAAVALASSDQLAFRLPAADSIASTLSLEHVIYSTLSSSDASQLAAHIDSLPEQRTVRFANGQEMTISEGEKALLSYQSIRYMDVTDEEIYLRTQAVQTFPEKLAYKSGQLSHVFDNLSTANMKKFLTKFTSYRTRYYRSSTGAESQQWLLAQLKEIAATNPKANISFTEFPHSWGQNSIIARFQPAASVAADAPVVILGAHLDSTNLLPFLSAPGAGDDGSGTTTLVSAFTALVNATWVPSQSPVEFMFFSAEEGGLLGSQAVAQDYQRRGVVVRSFLQQDMTSWVKIGTKPVFGVIRDFVDPALSEFIIKVIGEYAEIDAVDTKCGYACSDHASWTKIGVPSAFVIESRFEDSNPNIHSSNDKLDISPEYSFEHILQFARMSIALAVELGGGEKLVH